MSQASGLPFCRAFVVMNFHSESVDFVMDFCVIIGCGFFAYNWKLPAYSGAFLLTVDNFSFFLTIGAFLLTALAFLLTVGASLLIVPQGLNKKKKPINIKNFGGTPPGVRPVCPGDTSHLSRDMSRLSRGHSVPLVLIYT